MDKRILHKVKTLCASNESIIAAYLFGSAAKSTDKPNSDIDIAVLLDEDRSEAFQVLSFITKMEKAIGRRLDVVVLNRAGEVLKHEVRRFGIIIFERDAAQRKQFELIGRKLYEDFLYLHRRHSRSVLYGEANG